MAGLLTITVDPVFATDQQSRYYIVEHATKSYCCCRCYCPVGFCNLCTPYLYIHQFIHQGAKAIRHAVMASTPKPSPPAVPAHSSATDPSLWRRGSLSRSVHRVSCRYSPGLARPVKSLVSPPRTAFLPASLTSALILRSLSGESGG